MKFLEWMLDRLDAAGWWLFERGKPKPPIPLSDRDRAAMRRVNHPGEVKTATPVAHLMLWCDASPEVQVEELERVYDIEVSQ